MTPDRGNNELGAPQTLVERQAMHGAIYERGRKAGADDERARIVKALRAEGQRYWLLDNRPASDTYLHAAAFVERGSVNGA